MDHNFWHERWTLNDIGFHLDQVNPQLLKFWPKLKSTKADTVFIPLCGKSKDIIWLSKQVKQVYACELSQQAIDDFFNDNKIQPTISQHARYIKYQYANITIFCGDIFQLHREELESCTLVYDRASLIAFPGDMRQRYIETLEQLFPQPHKRLLITLEYKQSLMNGPPFSISVDDVKYVFATQYNVQCLASNSVIDQYKRFKDKGIDTLYEHIFTLQKN